MSFMVAIGHFAQPSVIELQAKVIRATCGDIPILVSDDYSETAFDESKGVTEEMAQARKAKLLAVCEREGLIFRHAGDSRIGHAGGDLGAFYHGLIYARDYGIKYLWKLSQRFIVDIPGWLANECRRMEKFRSIVCSQPCFYGSRARFAFRTESIGLEVSGKWARPDILDMLRPRVLHDAAEHIIEQAYAKISGGNPFLQAKCFGRDRTMADPDVYWKDNKPEEVTDAAYRSLAEKYGVELGDEFTVAHSLSIAGHRWG